MLFGLQVQADPDEGFMTSESGISCFWAQLANSAVSTLRPMLYTESGYCRNIDVTN